MSITKFFNRGPKLTGGNTLKLVGNVNEVDGQPAFNGVGTLLDWDRLSVDPKKVIPANCQRIKERFVPTPDALKSELVAVVGFGPSLQHTWEQVRNFKTIFSCSGAHKFLIERDILPTYHVESEPRGHKVKMLGAPHRDVTYLLASIIHPNYIDYLEEAGISKIQLWHLFFMEPEILGLMPQREWMITGGDTVGPRCLKIARLMGYMNVHLFGLDACADSKTETHAGVHANPRIDMKPIQYNGKTYISCDDWEVHAKVFLEDLDRMPEIKYVFHGAGLLQDMAANHIPVQRSRRPLAVETYAGD